MWANWNANRGISEESKSIRTEYEGHSRSLQGSHQGSFSVEFDVEAGVYSDRSSEVGTGRTTPIDWMAELQSVRARLQEQDSQDGGRNEQIPRAPSPYENSGLPGIPEVPRMNEKYASTYELERYKKNAMIIFNHKDFLSGKNSREGTMEDEATLRATFEMFNFEVKSHLDLYKKPLLQELKTFCSKDFREYGCVCVAILTHGSKHGYLKAYDTRYSEHEIIECFDVQKNPTLFGKPIIILIQACRGDELATACCPECPTTEKHVELDDDDHYELPTQSDMLIFHSSYVGRASARHVRNGSWFIQTLCDEIKLLAATEDFESICRAVRQKVALDKAYKMILNSEAVVAKQMPVVTCTLLRRLYLRTYEDVEDEDENSLKEQAEDDRYVSESVAKGTQKKRERKKQIFSDNARICGCDGYFLYMKKCLTLFIKENPDDEVAVSILTIAGNVRTKDGDKDQYNDLIRTYLVQNAERFKYSEVVFFGHSRNCHNRSNGRLVRCCSIM